jgi:DNA-binding transcriptional regulator YhcF (GntR family)
MPPHFGAESLTVGRRGICRATSCCLEPSDTLKSEARFLEKKTMEFTPASRSRAYRHIVDQVCDAIVGGDIQIGDMLPTERDMAAQSGISRTSVREAMKVLEECGLVARTAGAGGGTTIISDIVPVELAQMQSR